MKEACTDLLLFAQYVLTIPISSASAQRTFSTMKRFKTYLRSTVSDHILPDLCLFAIECNASHGQLSRPSRVINKSALLADRKLPPQKKLKVKRKPYKQPN
jgi:hypothetical protein